MLQYWKLCWTVCCKTGHQGRYSAKNSLGRLFPSCKVKKDIQGSTSQSEETAFCSIHLGKHMGSVWCTVDQSVSWTWRLVLTDGRGYQAAIRVYWYVSRVCASYWAGHDHGHILWYIGFKPPYVYWVVKCSLIFDLLNTNEPIHWEWGRGELKNYNIVYNTCRTVLLQLLEHNNKFS